MPPKRSETLKFELSTPNSCDTEIYMGRVHFPDVVARLGAVKIKFLIDTVISISMIVLSFVNEAQLNTTPADISSASGKKITCHKQVNLEIEIPCWMVGFRHVNPSLIIEC